MSRKDDLEQSIRESQDLIHQYQTESLCNFGGDKGSTTPVGAYSPKGDSPCGCVDVAGNVLELTRSVLGVPARFANYAKYPYDPNDGREQPRVPDFRTYVQRGGACSELATDMRCACRKGLNLASSGPDYGFRVCVVAQHD